MTKQTTITTTIAANKLTANINNVENKQMQQQRETGAKDKPSNFSTLAAAAQTYVQYAIRTTATITATLQ